ncbi:MAG: universal stress protein [Acidimicrobiales bacterium]
MANNAEPVRTEIVVGVDGSTGSAHALAWAIGFAANRPGLVVQPVVAWETPMLDKANPFSNRYPDGGQVCDRAVLSAATIIDPVIEVAGAEVEPIEAIEGNPGESLVDRAANALMLVVGSRGRGGITSLVLGSVSSRCATSPAVPTVVVPDLGRVALVPPPAERITVGVDGSVAADRAAVWARNQYPEAEIALLKAWLPPVWYEVEPTAIPPISFKPGAEIELDRHLVRIGEITPKGAKPFVAKLVQGDAREVLSDEVEADLLVLGAQQYHGMARAILGSVAQSVLHHLVVPTAIIPE